MTPDAFEALRPRLFGIAYRMTGDVGASEDLVQDAWARLAARSADDAPAGQLSDGYAVRTVTHLAIDYLRSARVRREAYVGPWLPEPLVTDGRTPESLLGARQSLRLALLQALEPLSPLERAAFVLRELLELPYAQLAETLERSEAACRQLVRRARQRLPDAPALAPEATEETLQQLVTAIATGDVGATEALLRADCALVSDGGGQASAALRPIRGAEPVRRYLFGLAKKRGDLVPQLATLNGEPALLLFAGEQLDSALLLDADASGAVRQILIVRNPDKLARLSVPR